MGGSCSEIRVYLALFRQTLSLRNVFAMERIVRRKGAALSWQQDVSVVLRLVTDRRPDTYTKNTGKTNA